MVAAAAFGGAGIKCELWAEFFHVHHIMHIINIINRQYLATRRPSTRYQNYGHGDQKYSSHYGITL